MNKIKTEKQTPKSKKELDRLRNIAEEMFINQGKSAKEISELLEVSAQTLSAWKKGRPGEQTWDERRQFVNITPNKLRERLLCEAESISQGNEPTIKADALSKVMAAIKQLDKEVNPRTVSEVLKRLNNYIYIQFPDQSDQYMKIHRGFLQKVIAEAEE